MFICTIYLYLIYRHTSWYCTVLYCALQTLHFFFKQIKHLCQPHVQQDNWCKFSNSFSTICVSESYFVVLIIFQTFYYYYYICYDALWSLIFDVTIVIGRRGCVHEPYPYKMTNLIYKCVCPEYSTIWPFSKSLSPQSPYFVRHHGIEIRPVDNFNNGP